MQRTTWRICARGEGCRCATDAGPIDLANAIHLLPVHQATRAARTPSQPTDTLPHAQQWTKKLDSSNQTLQATPRRQPKPARSHNGLTYRPCVDSLPSPSSSISRSTSHSTHLRQQQQESR